MESWIATLSKIKIYNSLAEKLTKKGRITEYLQALNAELNGGGGGAWPFRPP
jgi:hypothetical protein